MSTTITLMRLYLKMQSTPRLPLPHIGNAGILYSTPLFERNSMMYRENVISATGSPEFIGASKLLIKKGALGTFHFRRSYSSATSVDDVKKVEKERLEKKKFKLQTSETIKIMLVSETGSMSAVTLEEAKSIAKKKRLELIHIVNDKDKPVRTEKEVYKLMSRLESLTDDLEETEDDPNTHEQKRKGLDQKTIFLKSNIGDNDAKTKINMMLKWAKKGHRVRVVIGQAGEKGDAENIFKTIESHMKEVEAQIQQKIIKGKEIRFYIGPPKANPAKSIKTPVTPPKSDPTPDSDSENDHDHAEETRRHMS